MAGAAAGLVVSTLGEMLGSVRDLGWAGFLLVVAVGVPYLSAELPPVDGA